METTKLSENFTLQEFLKNSHGIKINPTKEQIINLSFLVNTILQPARTITKQPLIITSGIRNKKLNELVGGVNNSQHLTAQAADVVCSDFKELFIYLKEYADYDQIIVYLNNYNQVRFIHISTTQNENRRQIFFNKNYNNKNYVYTEFEFNWASIKW